MSGNRTTTLFETSDHGEARRKIDSDTAFRTAAARALEAIVDLELPTRSEIEPPPDYGRD